MRIFKIILAIFAIIIIGFTLLGFGTNRQSDRTSGNDHSPSPQALGVKEDELKGFQKIALNGKEYGYSYFEISEIKKLNLIANFTEKLGTNEIFEKYGCWFLVSGGFYEENGQPIGLFVTERKVINSWSKNSLFNGILSVNDFEIPRITRILPQDPLRIGLQAGPILIENGEILRLSLKNDKPARRMIAAVTGENKLYFLAIFNPQQVFDGPFLTDLPQITMDLGEREKIRFADAINLDGGSASAFYSSRIKLSELTAMGSFFCLK